jgi:hypothetical protein
MYKYSILQKIISKLLWIDNFLKTSYCEESKFYSFCVHDNNEQAVMF